MIAKTDTPVSFNNLFIFLLPFNLFPFFVSFYAHTKQKPPLQSKGGQEVEDNLMNCVLIQYIRNPPDHE